MPGRNIQSAANQREHESVAYPRGLRKVCTSGHTTDSCLLNCMCVRDRREAKVSSGLEGEKLQTERRAERERSKERNDNPKNGTTF